MYYFLAALLLCSVSLSLLALLLRVLRPFLKKRFAAKWLYYAWLFLVLGLLLPVRPALFELPVTHPSSFSQAQAGTSGGAAAPQTSDAANDGSETLPSAPSGGSSATVPGLPAAELPFHLQPTASPLSGTAGCTAKLSRIGPYGAAGSEDQASPPSPIRVSDMLFVLWIAGMLVQIISYLLIHRRFIRTIDRWRRDITDARTQKLLHAVCRQLRMDKPVRLQRCGILSTPMLIGLRRPVLLLPETAYSEEQLRLILLHELTHLRRRDLVYKSLTLAAAAMHWFNPIVRRMNHWISLDCELSCDEAVLQDTTQNERRQYGWAILDAAHGTSGIQTVFSTSFYGGKETMKERLSSIINSPAKRNGIIIVMIVLLSTTLLGGFAFANNGETQNPPPASSAADSKDITSQTEASSRENETSSAASVATTKPSYTISDDISLSDVSIGYAQFDEEANKQAIWDAFVEEYNTLPDDERYRICLEPDEKLAGLAANNIGYLNTITVEGSDGTQKFAISRLTPKAAKICTDLLYENKDKVLALIERYLSHGDLANITMDEMEASDDFPFSVSLHCYNSEELMNNNVQDGHTATQQTYNIQTTLEFGEDDYQIRNDGFWENFSISPYEYAPVPFPYFYLDMIPYSYGGPFVGNSPGNAARYLEPFRKGELEEGSLDNGICITIALGSGENIEYASTFVRVPLTESPTFTEMGSK